jgi:hypothetical protein
MASAANSMMACPELDHLACKLPGELEPRLYDVYATVTNLSPSVGVFSHQTVDIGNRDAPWHFAGFSYVVLSSTGTGRLAIRVYDSKGHAISDDLMRAGNVAGGVNAPMPINPSLVWPVNSSLIFDVQNTGAGGTLVTAGLFFFGFKIFDYGKAPC